MPYVAFVPVHHFDGDSYEKRARLQIFPEPIEIDASTAHQMHNFLEKEIKRWNKKAVETAPVEVQKLARAVHIFDLLMREKKFDVKPLETQLENVWKKVFPQASDGFRLSCYLDETDPSVLLTDFLHPDIKANDPKARPIFQRVSEYAMQHFLTKAQLFALACKAAFLFPEQAATLQTFGADVFQGSAFTTKDKYWLKEVLGPYAGALPALSETWIARVDCLAENLDIGGARLRKVYCPVRQKDYLELLNIPSRTLTQEFYDYLDQFAKLEIANLTLVRMMMESWPAKKTNSSVTCLTIFYSEVDCLTSEEIERLRNCFQKMNTIVVENVTNNLTVDIKNLLFVIKNPAIFYNHKKIPLLFITLNTDSNEPFVLNIHSCTVPVQDALVEIGKALKPSLPITLSAQKSSITNEALQLFVRSLGPQRNLKSVDLSATAVSGPGITALAHGSLEHLILKKVAVSATDLRTLLKGSSIRVLRVDTNEKMDKEAFLKLKSEFNFKTTAGRH